MKITESVKSFVEKYNLYNILILLVFVTLSFVRKDPAFFDIALIFTLIIGIIFRKLYISRIFNLSFSNILIILFLLGNIISLFSVTDIPRAEFFLSATLYVIIIYYFVQIFIDSNERMSAILYGYYFAAVCSVILAVVGYFRLVPWWNYYMFGSERPMALFKDPNVFGPFFIPLILWLLFNLLEPLNKKLEESEIAFRDIFSFKKYKEFIPILWLEFTKKAQLLRIFSIILFYWAVVFSGSRGAWINFFVAMLCFAAIYLFVLHTKKISKIGLVVFCIVVMVPVSAIFYYGGHNYLQSRNGIKSYDAVRFEKQAESLIISTGKPINNLGQTKNEIGKVTTPVFLKSFIGIGPGQTEKEINYATHSSYLRVLVENGWLTFLCFVAFLICFLYKLWVLIRVGKKTYGLSAIIVFSSIIGLLVNSLVIDTLHWRELWLVLGIGAVLIHKNNHENKSLLGG